MVAPMFERDLEQPIAGAIAGAARPALVVTEGNYLLLDEPRWRGVRAQLDVVWHLHVDDAVRRERLVARHVEFGKTPDEARAWVARVDDANAALVEAAAHRADLVVDLTAGTGLRRELPRREPGDRAEVAAEVGLVGVAEVGGDPREVGRSVAGQPLGRLVQPAALDQPLGESPIRRAVSRCRLRSVIANFSHTWPTRCTPGRPRRTRRRR